MSSKYGLSGLMVENNNEFEFHQQILDVTCHMGC